MHRNKAELKIKKFDLHGIRSSSKISNLDLPRNKAKLGHFSLALLPCTSVVITIILYFRIKVKFLSVDAEFAMATIGHVVKMLEDSSVPLTQHERLIKILGSSHSAGADQSYQCLAHHLKGLNSKSSATSKNIAAKCATQD